MKRVSPALLFIFVLMSACGVQEPLPPLQITGYSIQSDQPTALAAWYQDQLNFKIKQGDGPLLLVRGTTELKIHQAETPGTETNAKQKYPGFFKIGFKTTDLDVLYTDLKASGTQFRGEIFYDSNLQRRSLVALDPDGNRVQFFEDTNMDGLQAYFFSIMALNFEETLAWCESEFGFTQIHELDLPERGISIRLMEKDGVLLEIIGDESLVDDGTELLGIEGIVLNRSGVRKGEGVLRYNVL